jgi:hypothetical protein
VREVTGDRLLPSRTLPDPVEDRLLWYCPVGLWRGELGTIKSSSPTLWCRIDWIALQDEIVVFLPVFGSQRKGKIALLSRRATCLFVLSTTCRNNAVSYFSPRFVASSNNKPTNNTHISDEGTVPYPAPGTSSRAGTSNSLKIALSISIGWIENFQRLSITHGTPRLVIERENFNRILLLLIHQHGKWLRIFSI